MFDSCNQRSEGNPAEQEWADRSALAHCFPRAFTTAIHQQGTRGGRDASFLSGGAQGRASAMSYTQLARRSSLLARSELGGPLGSDDWCAWDRSRVLGAAASQSPASRVTASTLAGPSPHPGARAPQIVDATWARIRDAAARDKARWARGDGSRGYAQITGEFIPIRCEREVRGRAPANSPARGNPRPRASCGRGAALGGRAARGAAELRAGLRLPRLERGVVGPQARAVLTADAIP
jgi:hypothetical protein